MGGGVIWCTLAPESTVRKRERDESKRGREGSGAEKVKSPCEGQRILAMNKHICVVHIMPGIKLGGGGGG